MGGKDRPSAQASHGQTTLRQRRSGKQEDDGSSEGTLVDMLDTSGSDVMSPVPLPHQSGGVGEAASAHGRRGSKSSPKSRTASTPLSAYETAIGDIESVVALIQGYVKDGMLVTVLTVLCACTRFYAIESPAAVVFDEFHFGRFQNQYNRGEYFFDIHPPLGKLVFYFVGLLVGYDADKCEYTQIGHKFSDDCRFLALRYTSAVFGVITCSVLYYVTRNFGGSKTAASVTCILYILDNLSLIESRLILVDSQLIFWMMVSLWVAQNLWIRWNGHETARETHFFPLYNQYPAEAMAVEDMSDLPVEVLKQEPQEPKNLKVYHNKMPRVITAFQRDPKYLDWKNRLLWLTALAVSCAAAVSVKWTALATPGMIAIECFFGFFFVKRPLPLLSLLYMGFVCLVEYILWFAIHLALLPKSGDGDAFMHPDFQATLINNTHYDPNAAGPPFWWTFLDLNREMFDANARITEPHHWMSKWYSWPLNQRGVLYFAEDVIKYVRSQVYLLGNPAVCWLVLMALAFAFTVESLQLRYRTTMWVTSHPVLRRYGKCAGYCIAAYVLSLLPYIAVSRAAFIYHYIPSLLYGMILTGLSVDLLGSGTNWKLLFFAAITAVCSAVWYYYSPWVYATPLHIHEHTRRQWLPGWD